MSPYITQGRRDVLGMESSVPENAGELNYRITMEIQDYLKEKLDDKNQHNLPYVIRLSYTDYNEVIGVLECIKQELYRKVIIPYEEEKCNLNGEVFDV